MTSIRICGSLTVLIILFISNFAHGQVNKKLDSLQLVQIHSGVNGTTIMDIAFVQDILVVQKAHNLILPSWANGIMDKFSHLVAKNFKLHFPTPNIQRLQGGELLKHFLANMDKTVKYSGGPAMANYMYRSRSNQAEESFIYSDSELESPIGFYNTPLNTPQALPFASAKAPERPKKLIMYSAHDNTIGFFLNPLNILDTVMPTYASSVIVELHKNLSGEYYVEIFYRNDTDREPYRLQMPECSSPCYLESFRKILKPITSDNWEEECKIEGSEYFILSRLLPVTTQYLPSNEYYFTSSGFIVTLSIAFLAFTFWVSGGKVSFSNSQKKND